MSPLVNNSFPAALNFFTIGPKRDLCFARTCLQSAKSHHPEARLTFFLTDIVDQGYNPADEPFEVVPIVDLKSSTLVDMSIR
jgi:hypothetical protein